MVLCRLAPVVGFLCALSLYAANLHSRTADPQVCNTMWSATEAAQAFDTVLWALSQHHDIQVSPAQDSVSNALQQMELNPGSLMHLKCQYRHCDCLLFISRCVDVQAIE